MSPSTCKDQQRRFVTASQKGDNVFLSSSICALNWQRREEATTSTARLVDFCRVSDYSFAGSVGVVEERERVLLRVLAATCSPFEVGFKGIQRH